MTFRFESNTCGLRGCIHGSETNTHTQEVVCEGESDDCSRAKSTMGKGEGEENTLVHKGIQPIILCYTFPCSNKIAST